MNKFVLFLKKIYVPLLFIILEIAAINYYSNSTGETKARMLAATNSVVGGVFKQFSKVDDYFGLRRENDALIERIAELNGQMDAYRELLPAADTLIVASDSLGRYIFTSAAVINNTLTRPDNFLILDKGRRDGVEPDMAVVTPEGSMVGYVSYCNDRFAVVMSMLNRDFTTGARIKGKSKDYSSTVSWEGRDHNYVTLSEISKYADIAVGDTIVSYYSYRFPEDTVIGTVEDFELSEGAYYKARVRLAAHFAGLNRVLLARYAHAVELRRLDEMGAGM